MCIHRVELLKVHLIRLPYVSSYFVKLSAQILACSRCSIKEDSCYYYYYFPLTLNCPFLFFLFYSQQILPGAWGSDDCDLFSCLCKPVSQRKQPPQAEICPKLCACKSTILHKVRVINK
ncbi:unnamed protein product [Rangifer tarandus platyrhynchus]|uniref:Uncharacterized protein n=2 Tax=Rangifer tarandus platyrhynchus TaxID=3082113 RepID=A0ABN8XVS5_RANTA|nr:unnamed protein product [Rangifer tarandus platyrhynchus]